MTSSGFSSTNILSSIVFSSEQLFYKVYKPTINIIVSMSSK